jgi:PAS domain S-box-containing protein
LNERNTQLELAEKAALVGTYAFDLSTGIMQLSPGYAAIHGLPEGTSAISRDHWQARVHPDDLEHLNAGRRQSFDNRQRERSTEYRICRADGEVRWIESRSLISYSIDGGALRMLGVNIDVTERKRNEAHKSMLMAELDHRVKNALACVSAIAQHSRDRSRSIDEFLAVLDGRIRSLANSHTLLSRGRWEGVSLAELVHCELAPCAGDGNTRVEGPDVVLAADATQAVGMVLHELVTNAAKHGALSTPRGRVSVRWSWRRNGDARRWIALEWRELGGPPVMAVHEAGYGTTVIRDLLPYELGGSVDLVFAPEGVRCDLRIPVEWLRSGDHLIAASSLRPRPGAPSAALSR